MICLVFSLLFFNLIYMYMQCAPPRQWLDHPPVDPASHRFLLTKCHGTVMGRCCGRSLRGSKRDVAKVGVDDDNKHRRNILYSLWGIKPSCAGVGKLEFRKDDVDVPFSFSLNVDSIGKHSQNYPGQWWWCGRWCFIKTPAPAPAQTERKRVTWAVIGKGKGGKGIQVPRVPSPKRCDPFGDVNTAVLWCCFFKVVVLGPFLGYVLEGNHAVFHSNNAAI